MIEMSPVNKNLGNKLKTEYDKICLKEKETHKHLFLTSALVKLVHLWVGILDAGSVKNF